MKFHAFICISLGIAASQARAASEGEVLFKQNCSACHALDQQVVGPSLVEIRSIYLGKPDDFLKWCLAPGKKRPGTIDMPSMAHIPEAGLRQIHAYIMATADGVKEKKSASGDPFASSPTQNERPTVQRIFMPNSGPAAIAVALDSMTSLCWDAGSCRLRYAWTGGFIDGWPYWHANGSEQAKIIGTVRYTEEESPFGSMDGAKFKGYELKGGLPKFYYKLGSTMIGESFTALDGGKGFKRHFELSSPPSSGMKLKLSDDPKVSIESDHGRIEGKTLILTAAEAADFTLTIQFQ
ncbi:cytochrome c [Luteolibacter pohnpeiensis]|uniref:Cytochrome c n=1 Tax=Luteolibacter pohnpeiensis TaxID=454153 RepID=A0A934SC01_9BACT|nr:cytochrome c [Luteolibacter pohnpeiensis]MBK1883119.1 cytochrome c [Luteolibacter pohnpeiensis]